MQDANNKITDLTKKCKSLTEELMGLKKQSEEVHESKKVSKLLSIIVQNYNIISGFIMNHFLLSVSFVQNLLDN